MLLTTAAKLTFLALQFYSYEDMRRAEREATAARMKFYLGALSLAVFAAIWVFQRLVKVLRRVPTGTIPDAITAPPRKVVSNIIWGLALAFIAAAAYVLYLRVTGSLPTTAFLLVVALGSLGSSLLTQSRRLATPLAEEVLSTDPRAPILFLRSFREEEVKGFPRSSYWGLSVDSEQFEEAILESFRRVGPVVGLTNPGLPGRPLAYAPLDTLTADWQQRVDSLLLQSAVIVLVVAQTDGVKWEIGNIRQNGYLPRTMFILPPVTSSEAEALLIWLQAELGLQQANVIEVGQSNAAQPLVLRCLGNQVKLYSESPDASGYVKAVEQALKVHSLA